MHNVVFLGGPWTRLRAWRGGVCSRVYPFEAVSKQASKQERSLHPWIRESSIESTLVQTFVSNNKENNSWWDSLRSSALRRNAVPSSTIDQHPVFKDMSEALVFREWVCDHGSRIVPAVGCTSFLIAARSVAVVYR